MRHRKAIIKKLQRQVVLAVIRDLGPSVVTGWVEKNRDQLVVTSVNINAGEGVVDVQMHLRSRLEEKYGFADPPTEVHV